MEAQGFRDEAKTIEELGAVVVGVSADTVEAHDAWIAKLGIPFVLVSDPDHVALEAYATWGEREFNGHTYMGILRTTFLIDTNGSIERVWEKVKPAGHAEEVLEALRAGAA